MDTAKNFAKGTLSTGYDDEATSIVLIGGDGAKFPAVPFNAVWWNATDYPDPADDPLVEVVRVTARATDTLTITRAQESTAASVHDIEGKTNRLIAPLTAKLINSEMLKVTRTGEIYIVTADQLGFIIADKMFFTGLLCFSQTEGASTPGSVVRRLAVQDDEGSLVGYIPIYDDIT